MIFFWKESYQKKVKDMSFQDVIIVLVVFVDFIKKMTFQRFEKEKLSFVEKEGGEREK